MFAFALWTATLAAVAAGDYFVIQVVDSDTGRPVPLVELRTVHQVRYYTDSAGIVAFYEPGLMDADVYFHVGGHGYEHAADGFGFRGKRLHTTPGGRAVLMVKRKNIAERLYRVTGEGIFRDSLLVNSAPEHAQAAPRGMVLGSDSVVQALYRGRLYWFWGDTSRASYPLGNFHVPGAVSRLPGDGGLPPDQGVVLDYFLDDRGFAAETCRMPGPGPTWIQGLTVLPSAEGEQMFAGYMKIRNLLEVYERGIARFNDAAQRFEQVKKVPVDAPAFPSGHPFHAAVGGVDYVWFGEPFPLLRVRATEEDFLNLDAYESFTCLAPGSTPKNPVVLRDKRGRPAYAWRKGARPVRAVDQGALLASGAIQPQEALIQLQDAATGEKVVAHAGSVTRNAFRNKWIMIAAQIGGSSFLGETWYAEADTPLGPWCYARKVVSHDKYSFYNPKQHSAFDEQGGRRIYFEGTYTHTFSGNDQATPRYDYNQILYRLDLADERLALPTAVYVEETDDSQHFHGHPADGALKAGSRLAFFALDRAVAGARPVFSDASDAHGRLMFDSHSRTNAPAALFFALPHDTKDPPATTTPLYVFRNEQGAVHYSTDSEWDGEGYSRQATPLCLVWRNPWTAEPWREASSE